MVPIDLQVLAGMKSVEVMPLFDETEPQRREIAGEGARIVCPSGSEHIIGGPFDIKPEIAGFIEVNVEGGQLSPQNATAPLGQRGGTFTRELLCW